MSSNSRHKWIPSFLLLSAASVSAIWLISGYMQFYGSRLQIARGEAVFTYDTEEMLVGTGWRFEWFEYKWRWMPQYYHQSTLAPQCGISVVKIGQPLTVIRPPRSRNYYQVSIPLFPLGLLLWLLGLLSLAPQTRSPRHLACNRCGYCLSGNTSGICPECGSGIQTSAGA